MINLGLIDTPNEAGKIINLGLIGCGYWGANFIRIAKDSKNSRLLWCADLSEANLHAVNSPATRLTKDYKEMLQDKALQAVIVATPTETHFNIAKECLLAGKHVLVEKPLCTKAQQAQELIDLAAERKKILMVGHVFEFNEGIRKLREYVESKELGKVLYIHSKRIGLGPIREDVNALWDLSPHDISILLYLLKEKPLNVIAKGSSHLQKGVEDVVFLTIEFEGNIIANMHVSWLDPYKKREVTVVGDKKMAVFDDIATNETIKLFDKGVSYHKRSADFGQFKTLIRDGDILIPKVKAKEPLKEEFNHFIECIEEGKKPLTDGLDGLRVVKVLEAAQNSLRNNSRVVAIN